MKQYVEVEQAWYNELIRTKAKWELLIDLCIHKAYPKYDTEEVNDWVNDYYSQIGIKMDEPTIDVPKEPKIRINEEDRYKTFITLTKGE